MRLTEGRSSRAPAARLALGPLLSSCSMRCAVLLLPALATLIACGGRTTSTTGAEESGRGAALAANGGEQDSGTDPQHDGGGGSTGTGAPAMTCMKAADCASGICFVAIAGWRVVPDEIPFAVC